MLRFVLLLIVLSSVVGCTRNSTLGVPPEGDDDAIIKALLSPIDLRGEWRWIGQPDVGSKYFGGPCAEYALFGEWEVFGYGRAALYDSSTGHAFYETSVRVDPDLAIESMQEIRDGFTCSEWMAYGDDRDMIRFHVTPLKTQTFGDDTFAYQFWSDDDPDGGTYGGNMFIIRHGALMIELSHTDSDEAPTIASSERLVTSAMKKFLANSVEVDQAAGN